MLVIQLGKLMYMINVCSNTCGQAEKILQLGRKVIIEDKSPELTYELSLLVKMLKEEKVQFTAHDFFSIDYPLFISVRLYFLFLVYRVSHELRTLLIPRLPVGIFEKTKILCYMVLTSVFKNGLCFIQGVTEVKKQGVNFWFLNGMTCFLLYICILHKILN
ncbi:hypothetical protein WDU94_003916 [Cyamophila willieti]